MQSIHPFSDIQAFQYFWNNDLYMSDFMNAIHDLATHFSNFWSTHPDNRGKAIIRVHEYIENYKSHIKTRVKKTEIALSDCTNKVKEYERTLSKLHEDLSNVHHEKEILEVKNIRDHRERIRQINEILDDKVKAIEIIERKFKTRTDDLERELLQKTEELQILKNYKPPMIDELPPLLQVRIDGDDIHDLKRQLDHIKSESYKMAMKLGNSYFRAETLQFDYTDHKELYSCSEKEVSQLLNYKYVIMPMIDEIGPIDQLDLLDDSYFEDSDCFSFD